MKKIIFCTMFLYFLVIFDVCAQKPTFTRFLFSKEVRASVGTDIMVYAAAEKDGKLRHWRYTYNAKENKPFSMEIENGIGKDTESPSMMPGQFVDRIIKCSQGSKEDSNACIQKALADLFNDCIVIGGLHCWYR